MKYRMKFEFDLHQQMDPNNIVLVYEGKFDQQITKSVLLMAERNIDSLQEDPTIKRKVFNVIVECLQNIAKHGGQDHDEHPAIFMIGREEEEYIISSGNVVDDSYVKDLKSKIDRINSLDNEGLKDLYKQIMKDNSISEKGGAGLGLVDMARKSGGQLSYHFKDLDQDIQYFSFQVNIPRQIRK